MQEKQKGFAFIEILIILTIIGVLGGFIFIYFKKPRLKNQDIKRITDIRQLVVAQQMYKESHQIFFVSPNSLGLPEIPGYLPALDDPKRGKHYHWIDNTSNPEKFCAFAILDNNKNCPPEKPIKIFIGAPQITKETCVASITNITLENCLNQ
mgnify:CR=1 FL=1